MTWELLVAVVGLVTGVAGMIYAARRDSRASRDQTREDAMSLARIEGKLDSANRGIEDMRVEVRTHGNQISELRTQITRCEDSVKSAHHRIDSMERRQDHHEN